MSLQQPVTWIKCCTMNKVTFWIKEAHFKREPALYVLKFRMLSSVLIPFRLLFFFLVPLSQLNKPQAHQHVIKVRRRIMEYELYT